MVLDNTAPTLTNNINQLIQQTEASPLPSCPFVGLRPFESNEGLLFFGRRMQTSELLQQLHRTHFVAVVGSSGCGKSSLIRAGVIPKLKGGFLVEDRDPWRIAIMKPGEEPLANLASELLRVIGEESSRDDVDNFVDAIRLNGTQAVIKRLLPLLEESGVNLLLLIDQFEEIFRFGLHTDKAEQRTEASDFVTIMLELAGQRVLPIYVVMTMRSDFLSDCDGFYGLPEALNSSQYLVPRLTRQQRQETIEGPIRLYGKSIAPRLVDRVLNDTGDDSDQLPIMQHVLLRTWENWQGKSDGPLDITHYEAVGTVTRALSVDADKALEGMDAEELEITKRLFQTLTDTDARNRRIRRPAHLSEIKSITGASHDKIMYIIERFRSGGRCFLNLYEDKTKGDPLIDISHESLIRQWDTLRSWVDKEADSKAVYMRLAEAADLYKEKREGLYRNPALGVALEWRTQAKPNRVWAQRYHREDEPPTRFDDAMIYLDKSNRRQYYRIGIYIVSAALLVSAVIAGLGLQLKMKAQNLTEVLNQSSIAEQKTKEAEQARMEADKQREIAVEKSKEAIEEGKRTDEQRQRAETQAHIADMKKREAEEQRQLAERYYKDKLIAKQRTLDVQKQTEAMRMKLYEMQYEKDLEIQDLKQRADIRANKIITYNNPVVGTIRYRRSEEGGLEIIDNWVEQNIVPVNIPELKGIPSDGKPLDGTIMFYKGAAAQLQAAFREIRERGLLSRILTWDLGYVKELYGDPDSHNLGIAFDINKKYNPDGAKPKPIGQEGSVLELVPIFEKYGFTWWGTDKSFPVGEHFQVERIVNHAEVR